MSSYYEDSAKITFDRAEVLVERYIRQYSERRSRVTSQYVAETFEVETSHHNLVRINQALDERLEVTREAGAVAKQYRLP